MAHEDPIASLFGRYFTVRADKRKIDHSWNVGELEHTQRDAVVDYLQMPERVRDVEVQIGALRNDLSKLTEVISRLCNLESSSQPSVSTDNGGKGYVS